MGFETSHCKGTYTHTRASSLHISSALTITILLSRDDKTVQIANMGNQCSSEKSTKVEDTDKPESQAGEKAESVAVEKAESVAASEAKPVSETKSTVEEKPAEEKPAEEKKETEETA